LARTLEFDYASALQRATLLFWETGYSGTSMRDLLQVMGIGEGSFYNTLKSKKHAYLKCLKHYAATIGVRRRKALLAAPTAASGVRAFFKTVLDCLDDPNTPSRVCLMAASITPEVLAEPDLREYVQEHLSMLAEQMTARLIADKEAGTLPAEFDAHLVVPVVLTYLQGLWRMALVAYDRRRFEKQIDLFLSALAL
jgi:TetR/AcrR family transcriptional repressor of nem operon